MKFSEVIGQSAVKQKLIRSVQEERISHAQLFIGPPGSGKLPLAIAYAQYICCTAREDGDSCGTCPSCVKFGKLAHPDLHFVFPVVNRKESSGKTVSDHFIGQWRDSIGRNPYISENQWYEEIQAENKQGFISRNESNEVLRKLSLKSYESEYKILIMWLAEKMHPSAANSLLKIIEEPPQKTLFLLISENTDPIPSTILSRTQMITVPPLSEEHLREGLSKRFPDDGELINDVVRRANGNFSTAVGLMESGEMEREHFEQFVFLMRKCYKREIVDLYRWTDEIARWGRERIKMFLGYGLRMVRENFMLNLQQQEITFLTEQENEFSSRFSSFIHQGNVFELAHEFELAIDQVEANGQARIILFDLAIRTILLLKQPDPVKQ